MPPDPLPSSYEGWAFHKDFPRGKSSGAVSLTDAAIRFDGGGKAAVLPLDGLRIERGGASDRLLFFTNDAIPDWKIFTTDFSILDARVLSERALGEFCNVRIGVHRPRHPE